MIQSAIQSTIFKDLDKSWEKSQNFSTFGQQVKKLFKFKNAAGQFDTS